MTNLTQAEHTFISHQALTHPGNIEGTEYASATNLSGAIVVRIASVEVIANDAGVIVLIMGSLLASGDDEWFELASFQGSAVVPETEALSGGGEAAGTKVIVVASTTNFVVKKLIYAQDASVVADGEWHRVMGVVTNTSVAIDVGLENAKDNSDFLWTEADEFNLHISDLAGLKRVNVYIIAEDGTGSNLEVLAQGTFATDIE